MTTDRATLPPDWFDRQAHDHTQTDLHGIAEQLARVERQQAVMLTALGELVGAVNELAAKVAEVEAEFGPLARKWTGRAAALSATPAARFVRSKGRDQQER